MVDRVRDGEMTTIELLGADQPAVAGSRSDGCPLCAAALEASASPFDITLAEGPGVTLIPALGMLTQGYLLIVSRKHLNSFAEVNPGLLSRIDEWIEDVVSVLEPTFGKYLVFEHGSCLGVGSGACIDHAHSHLVPMANEIGSTLLSAIEWEPLSSYSQLTQLMGDPYAYMRLDGRHYVVRDPNLPSQWLRRQVADFQGHDCWDWAIDDGYTALCSTLEQFDTSGALQKMDTSVAPSGWPLDRKPA